MLDEHRVVQEGIRSYFSLLDGIEAVRGRRMAATLDADSLATIIAAVR